MLDKTEWVMRIIKELHKMNVLDIITGINNFSLLLQQMRI